ncbi:MAG: hypothetical protein FWG73_08990 [Planctomycetaceae bacterium]|nr:hypothetical protein [Planctomycetaceae bacterium]
MTHKHLIYVFLICIFCFSIVREVYADPSALALLRGVEVERMRYEPIQARFTIQYINDDDFGTITRSYFAEVAGSSRRFEVFATDNSDVFPGSVSILKDGEIYHYRRRESGGVRHYDLAEAVRRADLVYDPRVLGLVDNPTADTTVRQCMLYDVYTDVSLVGRAVINETNVWHVRCIHFSQATADFWIEEPSFRVHRKQVETARLNVIIDSVFDSKSVGPFPSEIRIKRFEDTKQVFNRIFHIEEIVHGNPITHERFSLTSMDLPINTDVVDYRIGRRVGYWDGEKIVDNPVEISAQELRELMRPPQRGPVQYLGIGIGGAMILLGLYLFLRRRLGV